MDDLLPSALGLVFGAVASGAVGVISERAAQLRSTRLWKRHGAVAPMHATLLVHLDDLGEATAADIAVVARLPPDLVAEYLPDLVSAGWATVTDQNGPLVLLGVTGHGERTAAMVRDVAVHADSPVGSGMGRGDDEQPAGAWEQDIRALTAKLDRVVAELG